MTILYLGVWPGSTGHFVYSPKARLSMRDAPKTPWGKQGISIEDDVVFQVMEPVPRSRRQEIQGVRHIEQKEGWTLICWWDRSGDPRHGSLSAFALEGILDGDVAELRARDAFPQVFTRMDRHVGLRDAYATLQQRVARAALRKNDAARATFVDRSLRVPSKTALMTALQALPDDVRIDLTITLDPQYPDRRVREEGPHPAVALEYLLIREDGSALLIGSEV